MTNTASKPLSAKAQREAERERVKDELRALLPPGSTVYTILRHVSQSGMSRDISLVVHTPTGIRNITRLAAEANGYRIMRNGGLRVGGCGMDMGFHVVYGLSYALYPNGHHCIGREPVRCPSNDHVNDYGRLAREYDDEHMTPEYEAIRHSGSRETQQEREAYVAARQDWIKAMEHHTWSPDRVHSDGGYALMHQWL